MENSVYLSSIKNTNEIAAARAKGLAGTDHFNQTVEMVQLGSSSFRKVENYHLSCEACLLIAENADRKKPQVQMAQRFFSQSGSAVETVQNSEISSILLYKTNQGESRIEVIFNSDTFWMPKKRMAELYGVEVNTVNYHLKEIFNSGELVEQSVIQKIGIVQNEQFLKKLTFCGQKWECGLPSGFLPPSLVLWM